MMHIAALEFLRLLYDRQYRRDRRRAKRSAAKYNAWIQSGRPLPPPHHAKVLTVLDAANEFHPTCFVETGTYKGDMVEAVLSHFQRAYSIELNEALCRRAQLRFAGKSCVTILQGDSAKVLPEILKEMSGTCLFWLDGHYSEGITSKGDGVTPIMEELSTIFDHRVRNHVILIDDARLFIGSGGYPTLKVVMDIIAAKRPDYSLSVKDDVICAVPGPMPIHDL